MHAVALPEFQAYWIVPFGLICFFFGIYVGWRGEVENRNRSTKRLKRELSEANYWFRNEQARADILADELLLAQELITDLRKELHQVANVERRLDTLLGDTRLKLVRDGLAHT